MSTYAPVSPSIGAPTPPVARRTTPFRYRLLALLGVLALLFAGFFAFVRPWYRGWGSTAAERLEPFPTDAIIPDADGQETRAITIHANVDRVWPWVAQIGQDRGGFYRYVALALVVAGVVRWPRYPNPGGLMRKTTIIAVVLAAGAAALPAQGRGAVPEIRPFAGTYIPMGDQRDFFTDAPMFGVQTAFELRPTFHLLGSFAWAPSQSRYAVADDNVNIYMYDVGMELSLIRRMEPDWKVKPFLGLGAGARSYDFKSSELATRTCTSGYGALGTELQMHRVAFRVEGRHNVFCYRSPITGVRSRTRNDVGLTFGVAYHLR